MAEPRTLMQMAGAPGTPHPLETSAVVMIDAQNEYRPGGLFDPETAGFAIAAPVAPLAGETVVTKGPPNAFAGTDLDGVLKTLEVSSLVVGGFMTHMCVSSTVRAALRSGLRLHRRRECLRHPRPSRRPRRGGLGRRTPPRRTGGAR